MNKNAKLVAVPYDLYEEFLGWQKNMKAIKIFTPMASEKRALARARKNFRAGKYKTLAQLHHAVADRR
ncbi:hypothetical protein EXS71_02790 [Candidatus Uhrbacteria bacterium]|nr:hypothetical protein [Candidatus Uhrbacteria bacterium]